MLKIIGYGIIGGLIGMVIAIGIIIVIPGNNVYLGFLMGFVFALIGTLVGQTVGAIT